MVIHFTKTYKLFATFSIAECGYGDITLRMMKQATFVESLQSSTHTRMRVHTHANIHTHAQTGIIITGIIK